MDIRDKFIVVKVLSGKVSGPKDERLTKKAVLEKLEAEFVRVSNITRKSRSTMRDSGKGCPRHSGS